MREDLVIIGAGDFAREAMWLAERMNEERPQWNLLGFVDDALVGQTVDSWPVLGDIGWLTKYESHVCAACAIGSGKVRQMIWERLKANQNVQAATLIDPTVVIGRGSSVAPGSILCAGTVLTVAVSVGRHCILNLNCTVGHDTVLEDFVTVHPGSNISGKVRIGTRSLAGTGTKIIQGLAIAPDITLGAGAVVNRELTEPGTYVGVPARRIH